jgi:hypothetical protein
MDHAMGSATVHHCSYPLNGKIHGKTMETNMEKTSNILNGSPLFISLLVDMNGKEWKI